MRLGIDELRHSDLFQTMRYVLAAPCFLLELPIVGEARGHAKVPIERDVEVEVLPDVILAHGKQTGFLGLIEIKSVQGPEMGVGVLFGFELEFQ